MRRLIKQRFDDHLQCLCACCSGCTCFGLGGAGVSVNIAKSPLGPWTTGVISLDPGCANWTTCGASPHNGPHGCAPITQAQQNAVITIPSTTVTDASSPPARFIWTGDRWQSGAPDGVCCKSRISEISSPMVAMMPQQCIQPIPLTYVYLIGVLV